MSIVILTITIIALGVIIVIRQRHRPSHPYPPGPRGRPLIGNVADMPKDYLWLTFFRWGKINGPLTYLNIMGQPVIVINNHKTAVDLLEKRGSIYSDRYHSVMAVELTGEARCGPCPSKLHSASTISSETHAQHVESDCGPTGRMALQEQETRSYLNKLVDRPHAFLKDLLECEGSITLKLTYGAVKDGEFDFTQMSIEAIKVSNRATSGYLVDIFPILKYMPSWMPGAKFKQQAIEWKQTIETYFSTPFGMVKRMKAAGEVPASYCSRLLDENEVNGGGKEVETLIRESAGQIYAAGVNTTTAAIGVFFLVMLLYPEVQHRAQEEIDRVIGGDRLPSLQDREALPYIEAVLLECLRWYPVVPAGIPHCLRQDDVYEGLHIPAGSIVFVNLWGMSRDENEYPRPDEFDPSRWLSDKKPLDPRAFVFGYGRRICPGIHVAQASVWIAIASVLATFNIKKVKNSMGEDITPPLEFESGLASPPKPFACDLKPRSEKAVQLIQDSIADGRDL